MVIYNQVTLFTKIKVKSESILAKKITSIMKQAKTH